MFTSTDAGTFLFSDLYQDVEACTVDQGGNPSCTEVASKYGDSDLTGPGDTFTMDVAELTSAHLDGTYQVQSYDQNGNPIGSPETEHIVADWTGTAPSPGATPSSASTAGASTSRPRPKGGCDRPTPPGR